MDIFWNYTIAIKNLVVNHELHLLLVSFIRLLLLMDC